MVIERDRMVVRSRDLAVEIDVLTAFVISSAFTHVGEVERDLILEQLRVMLLYRSVLCRRISIAEAEHV